MALLILFLVFIFSVAIGSFLNVVIHRMPLILHQQWQHQAREILNLPEVKTDKPFNLLWPRSHCPSCQTPLRFWENIPLISYLLLRGKCHHCGKTISPRYFIVELLTAILSVFAVYHFGMTVQAFAALLFIWFLVPAFFIDLATQLLPDEITLSLLWLGLAASLWQIFVTPTQAIVGALIGYCSLWILGFLFKKIRGIEGMGHGDYKLFAAFGAWFGWQALPFIIFIAALLGLLVAVVLLINKKMGRTTPLAFGPYLIIAAWLVLFFYPQLQLYFSSLML